MPKSNENNMGWSRSDELAYNGFDLAMSISDYLVSINLPITRQNIYDILVNIGNGSFTLSDPETVRSSNEKAQKIASKGIMNGIFEIRETAEQILRAYGGCRGWSPE